MTILETSLEAFRSTQAGSLRSVLAMLAVGTGVAALVAMSAIGAGAQAEIARQIGTLGTDVAMVLPAPAAATGRPAALTADDARAIARDLDGVAAAAPALRSQAVLVHGSRNRLTRVNGTTADYFAIRDWQLAAGRAFTGREQTGAAKVAVIGTTAARELFGLDDPVGREIRVLSTPVRIVGLLLPKGQSASGRDQDDVLFVPYATARLRLGAPDAGVEPEPVSYILAKAAPGHALSGVRVSIERLMRVRHRATAPEAFRVTDPAAALAAGLGAQRTTGWLLAAVSALAMVMGGIGIATVMLGAVAERTAEIGLRLAVGARPREIMALFLAEAALLCIVGGFGGVVLGLIVSGAAGVLGGWPVAVTPGIVAAALSLAASVGLASGLYPATLAARSKPAEALRSRN